MGANARRGIVTLSLWGGFAGTLAAPGIAIKALAPLGAALLWTVSGSPTEAWSPLP